MSARATGICATVLAGKNKVVAVAEFSQVSLCSFYTNWGSSIIFQRDAFLNVLKFKVTIKGFVLSTLSTPLMVLVPRW